MYCCSESGQATVEAAYLIPTVFLLLLVCSQPMVLLYNRMIMENAAAEGCRLLSTATSMGSYSDEKYEGYIKRRLAAIPPVDIFHSHIGNKSWDIELVGDENASDVSVSITNKLKPLPLLGWGSQLAGMCDADGYLTQQVTATLPSQPAWVYANSSGGPAKWVRQWS